MNQNYHPVEYIRGCAVHNSATFSILKTGGWRIFKPILSQESCNRCKLCYYFCPEGCVEWSREAVAINYDYCKGCGICHHECPSQAITMEREDK